MALDVEMSITTITTAVHHPQAPHQNQAPSQISMSHINWPDDTVFEPFETFEETYKTVASHDIKAAVLVPKGLKPGKHPLIVNVHGGFFVTAHSLFAPFFAPWTIKLALDHGAVIVSADYRLLPSPGGIADQNEDLEEFWQWTRKTLPSLLHSRYPGHELDFKRLLLTGASAGGYYTAQLALTHPDEITVWGTAYPAIDITDDVFFHGPSPGAPTILRFPADEIPSREESLAWAVEQRKKVVSKGGFEHTPYAVGLTQHGDLAAQIFESGDVRLQPKDLPLERVKGGARLPRNVWIIHGDDDSVVYLRQSEAMVDLIKRKLPETNLRFDIAKEQDHAFDIEPTLWEPYGEAAMKFVSEAWLGLSLAEK